MRLKGKNVVVTGASRGIGLEISRTFAREGATVAMLARGAEELEAAAQTVPGSRAYRCDIADPHAVASAIADIDGNYDGIDILINNAALAEPTLIEEADDADLQLQIAVNLLGPIYCMRAAIPSMRRRGGGDIVNLSSESVSTPYPFLSVYAATKSALETLSAGMRAELKGSDIRVSVYRSGRVASSFSDRWDPATSQRIRDLAEATGFNDRSGGRISPEIPARAILSMVLLDRSAHVDLLQVRGA